jgi:hypothetical protein
MARQLLRIILICLSSSLLLGLDWSQGTAQSDAGSQELKSWLSAGGAAGATIDFLSVSSNIARAFTAAARHYRPCFLRRMTFFSARRTFRYRSTMWKVTRAIRLC